MNNSIAVEPQPHPRSFGLDLTNQRRLSLRSHKNPHPHPPLNKLAQPPCSPQNHSKMDIEGEIHQPNEEEAYYQEICDYILSRDGHRTQDYFANQVEITSHMRAVLINWIVNVHLKYQLAQETLFLTVNLIDGYLEKESVEKSRLQLLGITALWIAAKYEEVYQVPKMSNLVYITDSVYTKEDILDMEHKILTTLQFGLLKDHPLTHLLLVLRKANFQERDVCFAKYLCELSLVDFGLRKLQPRVLISGILYLIRRMRKTSPSQTPHLEDSLLISQPLAKSCAKQLYLVMLNINHNSSFGAVRSKYSTGPNHEVGKIVLKHKSQ